MKREIGAWKALELGARNGVIIGSVFGFITYSAFLRSLYRVEHEYSGCCAPSIFRVWGPPWQVPLLSVVCASLASLLVHRLLSRRVKSTILLWQAVGLVALLLFFLYGWGNILYVMYRRSLYGLPMTLEAFLENVTADPAFKALLFPVLPIVMAYNLIFALILGRGWRTSRGGAA